MTELSGRFKQSPGERKRYVLDHDLDLDTGEVVEDVEVAVTSPSGSLVLLVCDDVVIAPTGRQFTFYASLGEDAGTYEIQFLATTSLEKILESVVQFDIATKVSA